MALVRRQNAAIYIQMLILLVPPFVAEADFKAKPGFHSAQGSLLVTIPDDMEFRFATRTAPVTSTTTADLVTATPLNTSNYTDIDENANETAAITSVSPIEAPTVSPTAMPTPRTIGSLRRDLLDMLSNLREINLTIEELEGSIGREVINTRSRTDSLTQFASKLEECWTQNKALGANGTCGVPLTPKCPPIEPEGGVHVNYSPDFLSSEILAGTTATFSCDRGSYIANGSATQATCLFSEEWSGVPPSTCSNCSDSVSNCAECDRFGVCLICDEGYGLFEDNSSGTQRCISAPGESYENPAPSCDVLKRLYSSVTSGVFWLNGTEGTGRLPVKVYCDMSTLGGGWSMLTSVQEELTDGGIPSAFAGDDARNLWIKGCGRTDGSIGCHGKGPDVPGWRSGSDVDRNIDTNGVSFRSLDWTAFLQTGQLYQLRQTLGLGTSTSIPGGLNAAIDVVYTFFYPGFVTQDDAPYDSTIANLTWRLTNQTVLMDTTFVDWDSAGETVLTLPWSLNKRGNVACSLDSFYFGSWMNVRFAVGSAGITNTNGVRDPAGVAWFPHIPRDQTNCFAFGPHQGGIPTINNWCGQGQMQGAYWLRKVF